MALPYEPPSPPVTHAAAKPPARRPAARQAAAPVSLLGTALSAALTPVDTTGLRKAAAAQAKADIAAQLAAYHAQQAQTLAQARQQAQQIGQAAQSAANYLAPLGDKTAQDWANAVQAQTGIAQGFTGQLRTDAEQAAQQAQAQIAGSGSGAQANDQSASLANLLYGLSGKLPADVLQVQGLGATAAARALPSQTLAYGQQQQVGALGQGNLAAQQFAPEIAKAIGSQPGLTAQYLSDLTKQATDTQQARADALFKAVSANREAQNAQSLQDYRNRPQIQGSAASGYFSVDPVSGRATRITQPAPDIRITSSGGIYQVTPTGVRTLQTPQIGPTLRSGGDGSIVQVNPDGTTSVLYQPPQQPTIRSVPGGGIVQVNPDGSTVTLREPDKTATAPRTKVVGSDKTGRKLIDATTGKVISVISKPVAGTSTATGKISNGLRRSAENVAQMAHDGQRNSLGEVIVQPQNRAVAKRRVVATLRAGGVGPKAAAQIAEAILLGAGYPPPTPKGKQTPSAAGAVTDWISALTGQPASNTTPGNLFG